MSAAQLIVISAIKESFGLVVQVHTATAVHFIPPRGSPGHYHQASLTAGSSKVLQSTYNFRPGQLGATAIAGIVLMPQSLRYVNRKYVH
jgi:hypothetical protein